MIQWNKRAKRDDTMVAERRVWKSRCGHYQVIEVNIRYGRTYDSRGNFQGYPIFYLAMAIVNDNWKILSEHRKRSTAVAQCEHWHAKGCLMPKRTKTEKAVKRVKAKRQAKRKAKTDETES